MAGQKKQSKTTTKTTDTVEEVTVAATATNEVVDSQTLEAAGPYETLNKRFETFSRDFKDALDKLSALKTQYRILEKDTFKLLKTSQKRQDRKKSRSGEERKPSGFTKPAPISAELASFIGKPAGTLMARTAVTKEINAYIKQHSLQSSSNGRVINPDKKLSALLKINKGEELTYFNLQKYMSKHFPKA